MPNKDKTTSKKVLQCKTGSCNRLRYYGGPFFADEEEVPIDDMEVIAFLPDEQIIKCKISKGYLTDPYLWQRGKVRFHLVDDNIGSIEEV